MRTLFLMLTICLAGAPAAAEGTLTVTGQGAVSAAPDEARVAVGVTTQARSAAIAMRDNGQAMAAVMARLAEAGIAAADLRTTALSLQPVWEYGSSRDGTQRISGFVAANMLDVRVRDLDALGGVLDAALGDGANTLGGIAFAIADDRALRDAARRAAVADAMARAQVLAEAAGVTLGPVIEISEGGGGRPVPFARMEMAMADSVPVAPGEMSIEAQVTMTWAIAE
jgi:uncharacterized protein